MGTRHFDIENRIEPKNETKRNANIRRLIYFWYSTGLSVDRYHYRYTYVLLSFPSSPSLRLQLSIALYQCLFLLLAGLSTKGNPSPLPPSTRCQVSL